MIKMLTEEDCPEEILMILMILDCQEEHCPEPLGGALPGLPGGGLPNWQPRYPGGALPGPPTGSPGGGPPPRNVGNCDKM